LTTDFSEVDMLIVDGLYAIATEGLDLRVFIDLTYHETKRAQALRGKELQDELRWRVLEQEHRVVRSLWPRAELVVTREYELLPASS
jgi:uridine kinase